jgi:hypothetical protein
MLLKKYRSVSPLIATILLIVVSVILVIIILTWGSNLTTSTLSGTNDLLSEDPQLTGFIFLDQLNYNIFTIKNSSNRSVTFVGYEIISDLDLDLVNTRLNFTSPINLSAGSTSQLPLICVPASLFSLNLITDNGTYVPINLSNINGSIPDGCRMEVVGNGSESDPYKIYNVFQLNDVRNYLDQDDINFTLEKNIDFEWISLSEFSDVVGFEDYDVNGWNPIGYYDWPNTPYFKGNFDGKGNIIKNLYIYRPSQERVGLFGRVSYSEMKNIEVVDVNVTGRTNVGGLIGIISDSILFNLYSTGNVTGRTNVGGLIGQSWGMIIQNSFFSGSVFGLELVGGFMGAFFGGIINNNYVISEVVGDSFVGGFIGYGGGDMQNNYSLTNVYGDIYVGGFMGSVADDAGDVNLFNNYSEGPVDGFDDIGGFLGYIIDPSLLSLEKNFWDINTSNTSYGYDFQNIAEIEGKTTEQMKQRSTYVGWDFDIVWQIQEGVTYPYLRSNAQSPPPQ